MALVAPDILQEARELSLALIFAGLFLGLLLWMFGWRGHRFWIVLSTTVCAGILGLSAGASYGTQPLLAGVLLAIAAGVLALAMVRVVAFIAGGAAAWMVVQALAPSWHEPLVCFLAGGLLGLLLFRIWTMALTSYAGTMLVTYSSLSLIDRLGKLDAVVLAEQQPALLNAICGGIAISGLLLQFLLERRRGKSSGSGRGGKSRGSSSRKREEGGSDSPRPWLSRGLDTFRRAG